MLVASPSDLDRSTAHTHTHCETAHSQSTLHNTWHHTRCPRRIGIKVWHQGVASRCGIKVWHQGVSSRCGIKVWHGLCTHVSASRCGIKVWHQGVAWPVYRRIGIKVWHQIHRVSEALNEVIALSMWCCLLFKALKLVLELYPIQCLCLQLCHKQKQPHFTKERHSKVQSPLPMSPLAMHSPFPTLLRSV